MESFEARRSMKQEVSLFPCAGGLKSQSKLALEVINPRCDGQDATRDSRPYPRPRPEFAYLRFSLFAGSASCSRNAM